MEYKEQTTFNMATATLMRMDSVLKLITISSLQKDFTTWRDCLFDMQRQLAGFIDDDEEKELNVHFDSIKGSRWTVKDAKGNSSINQSLSNDIYFTLHDTTRQIYKIMGEKGLLMRRPEDPTKAIISN